MAVFVCPIRASLHTGYTLFFYTQDHLGNIRQVTKASGSKGTVIQTMNYYPFGAQFCDGSASNSDVQSHKYNGKEFDKMHGLNTYDYGARQYNPVTGRWDRVDPLCEEDRGVSPYVYCADNPIKYIDLDGRKKHNWIDVGDSSHKNASTQMRYENRWGKPFVQIWAHGMQKDRNSMAWGIYATVNYKEKRINGNGYCTGKEHAKIQTAKKLDTLLKKYDRDWKNRKDGEKAIIILHSCSTSELAKEMSSDDVFKDVYIIAPNFNINTSNEMDENSVSNCRDEDEENRWEVYQNGESVKDKDGNSITYPRYSQVGTEDFEYGF